jgi:uncharacterized protein YdeI (YjbR/CyaY-like superfamily)
MAPTYRRRTEAAGVDHPGKRGIREITDPAKPHGYWACEFRQSLLEEAKKPETRKRRLEKFVAMLERGEKIHT